MNTLNLHSKLKTGRVGHAAVYLNNKDIYVIGGYNATSNKWLSSVEVCHDAFSAIKQDDQRRAVVAADVKQPEWEEISQMNEARY
jgi:N-acetylneuraminic acid mutarotase